MMIFLSQSCFEERERSSDEKVHEPAEKQSAYDHDQEEGDKIADLSFSFASSNQSEDNANKQRIDNQ